MPRWMVLSLITGVTVLALAVFVLVRFMAGGAPSVMPGTEIRSPSGTVFVPDDPEDRVTVEGAGEGRVLNPRPGLEGFAIPPFSLVDQTGEPVGEGLLEGEVSVVAFMFTNCETACPPITASMLRLYNQLEDTDVQFLSISVDPEHDTPETLRAYAARLGVDTDRWMFLTGEEGESRRVVAESLKFDVSEDPDDGTLIRLEDGSTMRNILHPIKLFLIGPDRQILDFCSPTVEADLQRFAETARRISA